MRKTDTQEGRWNRLEILVGESGLARLRDAHVVLLGLGGVGGGALMGLARSGVGTLTLVDADTVAASNMNRQLVAWESTVGEPKTEVAAKMVAEVDPTITVHPVAARLTPENLCEMIPADADYVIDAIDDVAVKLALAKFCEDAGIPLVASMGTARKWHPELLRFADISKTEVCPLCKVMRKGCKELGVKHLQVLYSPEAPAPQAAGGAGALGSTAFVPPVAGFMLASFVVRALLGIE